MGFIIKVLGFVAFVLSKLSDRYYRCLTIRSLGRFDEDKCTLGIPFFIATPQNVYFEDFSRVQGYCKIINHTGKFIIKKYSAAAMGLTVVTGNHTPTVGVPQIFLGPSHINDVEKDVIVEEDVWIGSNVTLLSSCHIGRGVVVGSCSLVNKDIPPYAVVVGSPAKIIAVKFSIEQILKHEELLYEYEARYTREQLEQLFEQYYHDKKVFGIDNNLTENEKNLLKEIEAKGLFKC